MTTSTDRPPVRPHSGRRPIPPLVFLVVLALVAAGVWWNVFRHSGAGTTAAACDSSTAAPPSLDPHTVTVHVLNATDQKGLATSVANDLKARGFVVGQPDNDRTGRTVTGVGEIRHGARGTKEAAYLSAYLPGATDYQDTRATAIVDLVLGPDFKQLATPDEVAAEVRAGGTGSC